MKSCCGTDNVFLMTIAILEMGSWDRAVQYVACMQHSALESSPYSVREIVAYIFF